MSLEKLNNNQIDKSTGFKRLLPHEYLVGLFLFLTWTRLVFHLGFFHSTSMVYLGCILLSTAVISWASYLPTAFRWRVRLLLYPIMMTCLYSHMRFVVPYIHPHGEDLLLQSIDHFLVGGNISLDLQPTIRPWLTEVMSICYLLLIPYLYLSLFKYFCSSLEMAKKFYSGFFSLYAIGLLSYTFMPALGPYLAMANQFTHPLHGFWATDYMIYMYPKFTNYVDVFPSLHCAISAYLLLFDWQNTRWRYWLYLIPGIGVWISTLYLRYHYFIDVISGFALAVLSVYITNRFQQKTPVVVAPQNFVSLPETNVS